jgi:hypothetical protein
MLIFKMYVLILAVQEISAYSGKAASGNTGDAADLVLFAEALQGEYPSTAGA